MNNKENIAQRILFFPVTKIILGLIACMVIILTGQTLVAKLLELTALSPEFKSLIKGLIVSSLLIIIYTTLYKFYEKRKIAELSTNRLTKNILSGILLGAILQTLTIFVIYLCKGFSVIATNNIIDVLPSLATAFTVAIIEEILFRGIIFRITEEKLGSYIALTISAFLFGALHLINHNSTLASASAVAIEAGLLLGAAYIYSKNLLFPIAIHFAWNFMQSGIYGAVTSGNELSTSLLVTKITGVKLITGGEFGPESSIQAIVFCLMATTALMILNHRQNKIIKPFWAKLEKSKVGLL
jgi:uncharacterized protein